MIDYHVTFSESALRTLVTDTTLGSGRARTCPAGLSRLAGRLEFLVHRAGAHEPRPGGAAPRVIVLPEAHPDRLGRLLDDALFFAPPATHAVVIALGVGQASGRVAGVVRAGGPLRQLGRVHIVTAGLPAISLMPSTMTTPAWPGDVERWSRTIGALGEAAWRRLCGLHVGLVGCGRTGSLLAAGLRRLGVGRLTLIDPDRLEPHNLGEMAEVSPADVGRPKAEALAAALAEATVSTGTGLTVVVDSVLSLPGLVALKPVDVLVCCVDRASARLATACLAAVYLKPLLDVGTGVLPGLEPDRRQFGADVRLLLPGRCLLCFGGVIDLDVARRELRGGPSSRADADWRRERRGSLRSLNGVAANLGLRLLEDFVAGQRVEAAWLRLETDATGLPILTHHAPAALPGCRLCALTGTGDAGLQDLRRALDAE